jgi:peroxiredoxin
MSVKVGDKAPDFKLFDQDAANVSLSDYKGKNVLLLFFPFANTGVCTKEMCTFRDELKIYEDLDVKVLAVSVDSLFALKMFHEKNNYNFPLLSDFNKETGNSYGVIYDGFAGGKFGYKGVAKRSAFIINKEGIVKYAEVLDNAGEEPNYENIKSTIKELS